MTATRGAAKAGHGAGAAGTSSPTEGIAPDGRPTVHAETLEQWRDWLATHHDQGSGVWLVSWRKQSGRPAVGYDESVTEALAWGWVDSKGNRLDDERTLLWFAPRKPTSGWSRSNKQRVALLHKEGRMQPAGQRSIDAAKANGRWSLLDDVEDLVVPDDLVAAFAARPGSREQWDAFPPSARRGILEWIVRAKRATTRERRITETAEKALRGERANQWQPGASS